MKLIWKGNTEVLLKMKHLKSGDMIEVEDKVGESLLNTVGFEKYELPIILKPKIEMKGVEK